MRSLGGYKVIIARKKAACQYLGTIKKEKSKNKEESTVSSWDLLNIEVIEAAALLSTLSQNAVKYLQEEIEGGGKWREKSMHMQAMKHFSEALEVMAVNPGVKTMRDWIEFHEQRRGAEWIEQWGQWFYDSITKSVMYALYTSK